MRRSRNGWSLIAFPVQEDAVQGAERKEKGTQLIISLFSVVSMVTSPLRCLDRPRKIRCRGGWGVQCNESWASEQGCRDPPWLGSPQVVSAFDDVRNTLCHGFTSLFTTAPEAGR